jgi:glucose/arabinose dehydrogenase
MTRIASAVAAALALAVAMTWNVGAGEPPPAEAAASMTTEDVVPGAAFPTAMAFAPDGRLFYSELCSGDVRIVLPDDTLLPDPFVNLGNAVCQQDYGFLGLALDPDFETNHFVYVQYMEGIAENPTVWQPVIKRFTEVNNLGTDPLTLFVGPATDPALPKVHGADNIHFGPDGYLYSSIGDLGRESSQDLSTVEGKMLRLDKADGSAPSDNPYFDTAGADPRVYALGLRNSFDFTFEEGIGPAGAPVFYATENGPDRCDELNIILAGANYGWPVAYESETSCNVPVGEQATYWFTFFLGADPWTPNYTSAPTGIDYVDGEVYPSLGDSLLVCQWRNSQMRHLELSAYNVVASEETLLDGCSLDVEINPVTGAIYYTNASTIRRLIVDSDSDGFMDGQDFCPSVATVWFVPAGDDDCDGFSSDDETYLSTDPADACPDDATDDAWPPDFDMNSVINVADVVQVLPPYFGTTSQDSAFSQRRDLIPDSVINLQDVSKVFPPTFGSTCSP